MKAGDRRLARDTVRDATQQEVHQLKRENVELKQLVAELSLEGVKGGAKVDHLDGLTA